MRIRLVVDGKRTAAYAARRRCFVKGCDWTFEVRAVRPTPKLRKTLSLQAKRAAAGHRAAHKQARPPHRRGL